MEKDLTISKACFEEFPVLQGDRILLRRIIEEDIEDIFKIYSDPEVAKYDWYYPIEDLDKALAIIENFDEAYYEKEEITWGVARKSDNKIIGYCCLGDFDDTSRRCEIGYGFMREEWNKGYGTETVKALVKFAFEKMNINRLEGTVTLGNEPSVKVLKKCGFEQEGIFRERTFMKGEFVDDVILAILRKNYNY